MDTIIKYCGDPTIPEEKRAEFLERVLTVLRQGGMMQPEKVSLFEDSLLLISPPEFDGDTNACVQYNYFEDAFWPKASIHAKNTGFEGGPVGWKQFKKVICAIYVLREFYAEKPGIAEFMGEAFDAREMIGWLNTVLHERFTNARAGKAWEIYESVEREAPGTCCDLSGLSEAGVKRKEASVIGAFKYLTIAKTEEFEEHIQKIEENTPPGEGEVSNLGCAWRLHNAIRNIKKMEDNTDEEKIKILKQIITTAMPEKLEVDKRKDYAAAAFLSALLPVEVILHFISEQFGLVFWALVDEMAEYRDDGKWLWSREEENHSCVPVEKVSTSEFLGCSDDDRAYYWTEDGDVVFSKEMRDWLEALSGEYQELMGQRERLIPVGSLAYTFIEALTDADDIFRRIYPFRDMFYEFLDNLYQREYQASVVLLRRMTEQYLEIGKHSTDVAAARSNGRMWIRRYLAVLANRELRKKIFGF